MNIDYTPNVPTPPHFPATDVNAMQQNTNSVPTWITVDHIGFGDNDGGYHDVIHFKTQAVDPAPVGLRGELYTKQITIDAITDEVLYYQSGGGRIFQLTTNIGGAGAVGSAGANGWTILPGGIIMQWGTIELLNISTPVLFATSNIDFPQNCFTVNITLIDTANNNIPQPTVDSGSVSKTGFTIWNNNNLGNVNKFVYWTAIGN